MNKSFTINLDIAINDSVDVETIKEFIRISLYKGLDREPLYIIPDMLTIEVKEDFKRNIEILLSAVKSDIKFKNLSNGIINDEDCISYYGDTLSYNVKGKCFHGKSEWINGYHEKTSSYDYLSIGDIFNSSSEKNLKEILKQIKESINLSIIEEYRKERL